MKVQYSRPEAVVVHFDEKVLASSGFECWYQYESKWTASMGGKDCDYYETEGWVDLDQTHST